jgi:hypothetical protein
MSMLSLLLLLLKGIQPGRTLYIQQSFFNTFALSLEEKFHPTSLYYTHSDVRTYTPFKTKSIIHAMIVMYVITVNHLEVLIKQAS